MLKWSTSIDRTLSFSGFSFKAGWWNCLECVPLILNLWLQSRMRFVHISTSSSNPHRDTHAHSNHLSIKMKREKNKMTLNDVWKYQISHVHQVQIDNQFPSAHRGAADWNSNRYTHLLYWKLLVGTRIIHIIELKNWIDTRFAWTI